MDSFHLVLAVFEFVVLVFSLSLHEAAHAWMASRLGDPTARMLGRVTLNPIKHIDLVGTVIIPLFMLIMPGYGQFLVGWAKPTPVTPSNFKNITRDDILTTLAGPCSNVLAAITATLALLILSKASTQGAAIVHQLAGSGMVDPNTTASSPTLLPFALLLYLCVTLNLILFVFNLLPLPPLDGSHVIRHMLPYSALRIYDSLGLISLILILFVGARLIGFIVNPAMGAINSILLSF
ncbi:MAG TPA: site-2 protease family protein [Acidobacteriaceae bacterium]|jgi:Zn-dependent protease|nr:site-2 protease family protein [Acidobacteriaceae bacterium]